MDGEDDDEEDDEENNDGDVRGAASDTNSKSLSLATPFIKADAHKRRYVFPFFFFFPPFLSLVYYVFSLLRKKRGGRGMCS
jgi:hypothetical protein